MTREENLNQLQAELARARQELAASRARVAALEAERESWPGATCGRHAHHVVAPDENDPGEARESCAPQTGLARLAAEQEAILSSIASGLVVYDADGRIVRLNAAAQQMLGYQDDRLDTPIGERLPLLISAYTANGSPYAYEDFPMVRALRGEVVRDQELVLRTPARPKGDLWVSVTAAPIRAQDGQLTGAVATFVDVGELHRVSEQLRLANGRLRTQAQELRRAAEGLEKRVLKRTSELAVQTKRLEILHEIDRAILAAQAPAEIAAAAAARVREATAARQVFVGLFDFANDTLKILAADGADADKIAATSRLPIHEFWAGARQRPREAVSLVNVASRPEGDPWKQFALDSGIHFSASLPLVAGDELIGVLAIGRAEPRPLPQEAMDLACHIADSLAIAIHNARLHKQLETSREHLQAYAHRLVEAVENERRAIARELHDEAGQALTALKIGLSLSQEGAARGEPVAARYQEMNQLVDRVMEDLHRLSANLRPGSLDRLGLVPAVRQYVESYGRQMGLTVEFLATNMDERLPPEVETNLYRLVQEALTNVARHAGATQADVMLVRRNGLTSLVVQDNGSGFDVDEALASGRLGLVGMRERAEMLGGRLRIESVPGSGTTVFVEVPSSGR